MMNVVALSVVLSSLLAAEVWSPAPAVSTTQNEDVIVKRGHRVVVVEYDQDDKPNTKVSISPDGEGGGGGGGGGGDKGVFGSTIDKIKETVSEVPEGISRPEKEEERGRRPGELICDAFGKCTHRIAGAVGRAKDKVSWTAHEAQDKAAEAGQEAADRAKWTVGDGAQKAQDAKNVAADKAHDVKESTAQKVRDVRESTAQKARDIKESMGQVADEAKDKAAHKVHDAKESATQVAEDLKDKAARNAHEGSMGVWAGTRRFATRVKSAMAAATDPTATGGVMSLVGFATAYGTCVWVTFVSSYVLAAALPRHQFGLVQSKIYPTYFRAVAWSIAVALLGHVMGRGKRLLAGEAEMLQALNLVASILMVLANALILEPRASKAMFERMKAEKEEGRGRESSAAEDTPPSAVDPVSQTTAAAAEREAVRSRMAKLSESLKRLNTYSSWLNIMTLMSLTWHLVYLGQCIHLTC